MGGMGMRDPNRIVDDIFRTTDVPPRFAPELTFGQVIPERSDYNYPSCPGGTSALPQGGDPRRIGALVCRANITAAQAAPYGSALDWGFNVSVRRLPDDRLATDQDACGGNRAACGYDNPWRGSVVFDLQGPANRVVVFPITDHVNDSCLEAFEYSVYMTDNPAARMVVPDGAPPNAMQWNRAVLQRGFLRGWTNNYQSTGTIADMAMHPLDMGRNTPNEAIVDSITTVWGLPCGINFRYVALLPGNYGNPDARCAFHSSEYEFDAVAGLNEDGSAICPDRDNDGFRDAMCGGTDCDDNDPTVNPGATEDCRSVRDLNCDGNRTTCPAGTGCFDGVCAPGCLEGACSEGFRCQMGGVPAGQYCVSSICAMGCPPGQVCGPRGCQAPCDGARCPSGQECIGGACQDLCAGVRCPMNQHCVSGRCQPNCSCAGCPAGQNCNAMSGVCETPGCGNLPCPPERQDCTGETPRCRETFCDGVLCPVGQRCDEMMRRCVIDRCRAISCPPGLVCREGDCVAPPPMDSGVSSDSGNPGTSDSGASSDGSLMDGGLVRMDAGPGNDSGITPGMMDGGCGCRVSGPLPAHSKRPLAALAIATALLASRSKRARKHR